MGGGEVIGPDVELMAVGGVQLLALFWRFTLIFLVGREANVRCRPWIDSSTRLMKSSKPGV